MFKSKTLIGSALVASLLAFSASSQAFNVSRKFNGPVQTGSYIYFEYQDHEPGSFVLSDNGVPFSPHIQYVPTSDQDLITIPIKITHPGQNFICATKDVPPMYIRKNFYQTEVCLEIDAL